MNIKMNYIVKDDGSVGGVIISPPYDELYVEIKGVNYPLNAVISSFVIPNLDDPLDDPVAKVENQRRELHYLNKALEKERKLNSDITGMVEAKTKYIIQLQNKIHELSIGIKNSDDYNEVNRLKANIEDLSSEVEALRQQRAEKDDKFKKVIDEYESKIRRMKFDYNQAVEIRDKAISRLSKRYNNLKKTMNRAMGFIRSAENEIQSFKPDEEGS